MYLPSGRLCLQAFSPYYGAAWRHEWREAAPGDLLQSLGEVLIELKHAAPTIVEQIAESKRQAEIQALAEAERKRAYQREQEEKARAQAINASVKQLHAIVDAWTNRTRIERFFADAQVCAEALPEPERLAVAERIRRARRLLNPKNPVERLLTWTTPEERLPPELRVGLDEREGVDEVVREEVPVPPAPRPPPLVPEPTYWESRHWWQRR